MKKTLLAALLVLLMGFALAESTSFSFRSGAQWGMSSAEVLALEGADHYEARRENGLDVVVLACVTHLDAPCDIHYLFFKDSLCMLRVVYDAGSGGVSVEGLLEKLSARYGKATPLSPGQLKELLLSDTTPDAFYGWVLTDETLICLAEYPSKGTIEITCSDLIDSEG